MELVGSECNVFMKHFLFLNMIFYSLLKCELTDIVWQLN